MDDGHWTVRTEFGETWGTIKKLIIDPQSRQISAAEIMLTATDDLVRVAWADLDVRHEGFFLKPTFASGALPFNSEPSTGISVDIPTGLPGRVRPRSVRLFPAPPSR